jgi:hypothetical protein
MSTTLAAMRRTILAMPHPTVLDTPPDFAIPANRRLEDCPWFRPCRIAIGPAPPGDRVLEALLPRLETAFQEQGHTVVARPDADTDITLACAEIPQGSQPLAERIPERERPLLVEVAAQAGLRRRPENLITLVTVTEDVGEWPHTEVVEVARRAMARLGTPKLVFCVGDTATGDLRATVLCTLEGGHPTDRDRIAERLRDRLVAAACAREVTGRYEVVRDAVPLERWQQTSVPDALVAAGRRMDQLGLLPAPKRVSGYVSGRLARLYERLLGIKGFSEGMLFAYDPSLEALLVTASGSWEVDKRALRRDEVIPVRAGRDGRLEVLAPEGVDPKGPSVEAWEMVALLDAVPRVRLRPDGDGGWLPDPDGEVEAPVIRGGVHVHVGVTGVDQTVVESLPANREQFPFGFGCGTDLMCQVAEDAAARSRAITDLDDPRAYVRWPMLYHGDTLVELWKPAAGPEPLEGLLDLFDPAAVGAVAYDPHHIDQPV